MKKRLPKITDLPSIETPVVDIQDLEHQPGPDTRVNNSGVTALPKERKAREAIEKLEQALREQFPR